MLVVQRSLCAGGQCPISRGPESEVALPSSISSNGGQLYASEFQLAINQTILHSHRGGLTSRTRLISWKLLPGPSPWPSGRVTALRSKRAGQCRPSRYHSSRLTPSSSIFFAGYLTGGRAPMVPTGVKASASAQVAGALLQPTRCRPIFPSFAGRLWRLTAQAHAAQHSSRMVVPILRPPIGDAPQRDARGA